MYKVIVDIAPKTIPGTNGCHKYVFETYKTKKAATAVMEQINNTEGFGTAIIEKDMD